MILRETKRDVLYFD